jgi:hypothetical protein
MTPGVDAALTIDGWCQRPGEQRDHDFGLAAFSRW